MPPSDPVKKLTAILLSWKQVYTPSAKEETAYLNRHTICPNPPIQAGEIMDYLHTQLCLRKMNEEHVAGVGIWETDMTSIRNTNTRVCWGLIEGCCFRDKTKAKTVLTPYQFQLSVFAKCTSVSPSQAWGKCCPPAALGSHSQSLHLQSNSIKSRPAANKPWQILSFEIHFGTAVVPSKRGDREGEASSQYNICRVSARPGWQRHELLSQETSVQLSHSTAGQSIWLQCFMNSINSYLPFGSYYAE